MSSYHRSFTYDRRGNRTSLIDHLAGETTTYTYDAANQLTLEESVSGPTTYMYDRAGRCTRQETPSTLTDFQYDALGRVTVAEPVSGPVSFTYNGAGQRVKKEAPTETTRYLYDFKHLLAELDGAGDTESLYTYADNEYGDLISQYDDVEDESSYFHYDAQWSTNALADAAGDVTDRWQYSAFGLSDHATGTSDTPHTFVGKQGYYRDPELSLYLLGLSGNETRSGGRFYNPALGRFLVPDPLGLDPDQLKNPYRYVNNNPINKIDPSGLWPAKEFTGVDYWRSMFLSKSVGEPSSRDADARPIVDLGEGVLWRSETQALYTDCKNSTQKGRQDQRDLYFLSYSPSNFLTVQSYEKVNHVKLLPLEGCIITPNRSEISCKNGAFFQTPEEFRDFPLSSDASLLGLGIATIKRKGHPEVWSQNSNRLASIIRANRFKKEIVLANEAITKDPDQKEKVDTFWDSLFNFLGESSFADVVAALFWEGASILDKFFTGLNQGFSDFSEGGFIAVFKRGLKGWLAKEKFPIPDGFSEIFKPGDTVQKFIKFGLQVIGYAWEDLLDLTVSAIPEAANLVLKVVDWIWTNFPPDAASIFESVQSFVTGQLTRAGATLKDLYTSLRDDFWKFLAPAIGNALNEQIIIAAVTKLATYIAPGAVGFLRDLYRLISFIKSKFEQVTELYKTVTGGLKGLLNDKIDEAVQGFASSVNTALQNGIELAFGILAKWLNIDTILDKIKTAAMAVKNKAQAPVKFILSKLGDTLSAFLGPLKAISGEGSDPFIKPAQGEGGNKVWVEVKYDSEKQATATAKFSCGLRPAKLLKDAVKTKAIAMKVETEAKLLAKNVADGKTASTTKPDTSSLFAAQIAALKEIKDSKGSCFVSGTVVHLPHGLGQIDKLRIGERVLTYLPSERLDEISDKEYVDSSGLRHLSLSFVRADGSSVQIELLRNLDWIGDYFARVGNTVRLDMPEMGVDGLTEVLAIEPCPSLEDGNGCLITGKFKHTSGEVYDLSLEGESEPIGVTGSHPFWSVDRNAWVSAVDLRIGETLKSLEGTTVVESFEKRTYNESVYNLEVDADHCYRVGQRGLLVHNASTDPNPTEGPSKKQGDHVFNKGLGKSMGELQKTLNDYCAWPELAVAFGKAKGVFQSEPFKLTVDKGPTPIGGDPNAELFGKALDVLRQEINAYLESSTTMTEGEDAARAAHAGKIQQAWDNLIANSFDQDAAKLVVKSLQKEVKTGQKDLIASRDAVNTVLSAK